MTGTDDLRSRKAALRSRVLARRRAVPAGTRTALDTALRDRLTRLVDPGTTVAAYVPSHGEAGGPGLPGALSAAGARVLLPVSPPVGPLGWAVYRGDDGLTPGRFGIPVPGGEAGPPESLADVSLVLVPAVAADVSGLRLGRGGGYYDRSLSHASPSAVLLAVLDEEDVLDRVPAEPHDLRVHGIVTPARIVDCAGPHDAGVWHSTE